MARKGEPGGLYEPEPIDPSLSKEALIAYVERELWAISSALLYGRAKQLEVVHVAPSRPRDGLVVVADGTDWDPVPGPAGPYIVVYLNGSWERK